MGEVQRNHGRDIFRDVLSLTHISDTQKRLHADNEVLLLLQEELEGDGYMS